MQLVMMEAMNLLILMPILTCHIKLGVNGIGRELMVQWAHRESWNPYDDIDNDKDGLLNEKETTLL